MKAINSALISVFYKDGLDEIVNQLNKTGVKIFSTGGTLKYIQDLGISVTKVEDLTGFPEILGGRVKTLHPTIFGGILNRRNHTQDQQDIQNHNIPNIDLVIVDLYPFEETLNNTNDEVEIIEKIDIGGISLIRATAKNFNDTAIISSKNQYKKVLDWLYQQKNNLNLEQRKELAKEAFFNSSNYDSHIFDYFNNTTNLLKKVDYLNTKKLRYGENPHQKGVFYGKLEDCFEILQGKELSYNNLVDLDSILNTLNEFDECTFAIVKHTNTCGIASHIKVKDAYLMALAGDPTSAFGGVLACNREIDEEAASEINNLFFELLVAPSFTLKAIEILSQKKNRILLKQIQKIENKTQYKTILNGVLYQDNDLKNEKFNNEMIVTNQKATDNQLRDLEFAVKVVKNLKSNGIALVKNKQLIGMGCGQTSRIDALEFAIKKAKQFGFDTNGAVMASEAFFPFPDCVEMSFEAGIVAIAQPGGSIKDKDSIDAADKNNQVMLISGIRHFKH